MSQTGLWFYIFPLNEPPSFVDDRVPSPLRLSSESTIYLCWHFRRLPHCYRRGRSTRLRSALCGIYPSFLFSCTSTHDIRIRFFLQVRIYDDRRAREWKFQVNLSPPLLAIASSALYVSKSTRHIHGSLFPYLLSSVPCNLSNPLLFTHCLLFFVRPTILPRFPP